MALLVKMSVVDFACVASDKRLKVIAFWVWKFVERGHLGKIPSSRGQIDSENGRVSQTNDHEARWPIGTDFFAVVSIVLQIMIILLSINSELWIQVQL